MEYQVFLCIFLKNSAMATLGLKEMGKLLWEGREKGVSQQGHLRFNMAQSYVGDMAICCNSVR